MRRILNLLIGITISGVTLAYFFSSTPENILEAFFGHRLVVLIGCAILIPIYFLRALKYHLILKSHNVNFERLAAAQFAGIALNNLLPFRMGDVLRTGYIYQILGVPIKEAVISLFIERGIDLLVILLLLISFSTIFYKNEIFLLISTFNVGLLILCLIFLCFGLVGWYSPQIRKFNLKLSKKMFGLWPLNTTNTLLMVVVAILQWCLEIIFLGVVLSELILGEILNVSVLATFFSNLSTLIPSAPGYFGTFEAAGISAFQIVNFSDMKNAASFVLVLHASIWLFSTIIGILAIVFLPDAFTFAKQQNNHQ